MSLQAMRERLRRFKALNRREQAFFLRAAALLPWLWASLRLAGFRRTHRMLRKFLRADGVPALAPADSAARIEATVRMVRAAARHAIGESTCLEESLALWWLLGRQGIAARVRIGARKVNEKFEAHAWVECDGAALNNPGDLHRHYAAFDATFLASAPEAQ